jgi:hypothetical protein
MASLKHIKSVGTGALGAAGMLWAPVALACPGAGYQQEAAVTAWDMAGPVALLLGIPATVFALLVPSPLGLGQRAKLWPIQLWAGVLSVLMVFTLAFRERAAWQNKVEEAIRVKLSLEGLTASWKAFAHDLPDVYRSVMGLASAAAVGATMFMWGWTVASPHVTWGEGLQVPVTFLADSVLVFFGVRWMMRRVGFHLAAGLMDVRGTLARLAHVLFRGTLMGASAGWLMGTLFGLSSGIQTVAILDMDVRGISQLMVGYGLTTLVLGVMLTAVMAVTVLAVHKAPRGLLKA